MWDYEYLRFVIGSNEELISINSASDLLNFKSAVIVLVSPAWEGARDTSSKKLNRL